LPFSYQDILSLEITLCCVCSTNATTDQPVDIWALLLAQ